MKRFITGLLATVFCLSSTCFAMANTFVPSVGYKPAPELEIEIGDDGVPLWGSLWDEDGMVLGITDEHKDCIIITPVAEVDTSTRIPEDARQILKDVYAKLNSGEMKLSDIDALNKFVAENLGEGKSGKDLVVKDLFDVSVICSELMDHIIQPGKYIQLTFNVGIAPDQFFAAMVYVDGEWRMVEAVNNGDGTVSCMFEDICPVAFLVESTTVDYGKTPETGDTNAMKAVFWGATAAASFAALVVIARRKKTEE